MKHILTKKNRSLLSELVRTDFKLRYQGSVLGYMWSLLKPLSLFAILYVVFVKFLNVGKAVEHYPVYLLLGIVLWNFFLEATMTGMRSIVARGDLLRKIMFPKSIVIMSGVVSAFVNLFFNLFVVFIFILFSGVGFHWQMLLFPLVLLELFAFTLVVTFLLAAAYVQYRDLAHIWEVLMQAVFYATPIIYTLDYLGGKIGILSKIIMMSPLSQIIQDARYSLVSQKTVTSYSYLKSPLLIIVPFVVILVISFLSVRYFKHTSKYFAENV